MTTAELRGGVLQDVAMMGLRSAVGVIFIVHGYGKLVNPGFAFALENWGIPSSMHIPVALGELVPGILLLIGILTRISGGLLSIYMLGAIFLGKRCAGIRGRWPCHGVRYYTAGRCTCRGCCRPRTHITLARCQAVATIHPLVFYYLHTWILLHSPRIMPPQYT